MANNDRYEELLRDNFIYNMRFVDTIKPAVVTAVNGGRLCAKILTTTRELSGRVLEQAPVKDIPYITTKVRKGTAGVSLPLAEGDNVLVLFSDRDIDELLDSNGQTTVSATEVVTHRYEPILAIPFEFANNTSVSSDVTLEYDDNIVNVGRSGISLTSGSSTISLSPSGITIDSPSIIINGVEFSTHTHSRVTSGSDVSGPVVPMAPA